MKTLADCILKIEHIVRNRDVRRGRGSAGCAVEFVWTWSADFGWYCWIRNAFLIALLRSKNLSFLERKFKNGKKDGKSQLKFKKLVFPSHWRAKISSPRLELDLAKLALIWSPSSSEFYTFPAHELWSLGRQENFVLKLKRSFENSAWNVLMLCLSMSLGLKLRQKQ